MAYRLDCTYGKQSVPVFKINKRGPHHSIIDLLVKIMLEGDVSLSWLQGENQQIVPTETQKNTCYAIALQTEFDSAEDYAISLGRDILERHKHIHKVSLDIAERIWERVNVNGVPHNHVFHAARDPVKRSTHVVVTRDSAKVSSGVFDLKLLKTTQSGFAGYIQDKYTNLQPVGVPGADPDRIMSTELEAKWSFSNKPSAGYKETNQKVLDTLLEIWSGPADVGVYSKSVQETAYNMACTVLQRIPEVESVYLATPNIHHYTYPLKNFGLTNNNVVFQSTDCHDTASGRIETRVSRANARL